jgi:excisionase family DNA binding protein
MTLTKLLTIPQFANATGLSERAARTMIEHGQLPTVRVGSRQRVDVRWVKKWLATANPDVSTGAPPHQ